MLTLSLPVLPLPLTSSSSSSLPSSLQKEPPPLVSVNDL
jgi:hypothetical protein